MKNIDHKKIGLSSGAKVFTNKSMRGYYKLFRTKYKKIIFLEKKIASFWVANRTVIIKLLNDHIYSITHDVDVLALS